MSFSDGFQRRFEPVAVENVPRKVSEPPHARSRHSEQRGEDDHVCRWAQQPRCDCRAQQSTDSGAREDGALDAREQTAAVE